MCWTISMFYEIKGILSKKKSIKYYYQWFKKTWIDIGCYLRWSKKWSVYLTFYLFIIINYAGKI
jgi:hypothetical protein